MAQVKLGFALALFAGALSVFGVEDYNYTKAGVTYRVVRFTDTAAAQSWTVPEGVRLIDLLVVGGGGAGGGIFKTGNDIGTGGGGAGGLIHKADLAVTPGSVFTVKVGAGGTATTTASNGGGASWVSNSVWTAGCLAGGGGAGGSFTTQGAVVGTPGTAGGSGGGGCGQGKVGGAANGLGEGHPGGIGHYATWYGKDRPQGGGGGGADLCGTSPTDSGSGGAGGLGKWYDITGEMRCYAGGGAGVGGPDNEHPGASGACDGVEGLGGGGAGVASEKVKAGNPGGSGTVVIRYLVSVEPAAKPTNLSPNGTTLDLHNEAQLAFLRMSTAARAVEFTSGDRATLTKKGDCLPKPIAFSWTGGGTNTLRICRADGSVFLERTVVGTATEVDGFEVGADYTWTVSNEKGTSDAAAFTTSTQVPRLLREPRFVGATLATRKIGSGIVNIREPGGMVGLGGRRVKPNLLFRSAALNRPYASATNPNCLEPGETYVNNEAETNFWLKTLKIKTEVDLRDPDEYGVNATMSALGSSVGYVTFPVNIGEGQHCPCYGACFTEDGKKKVKRVLDVVMNPSNYPLVYHCSGGQDRTGSLAFVLEGLLGVDEDTLILDWECLALYSNSQTFPTIKDHLNPFLAGLNAYPGETINDRIVAFVKDTGVTDEQIMTFRTAMLEGYGEPDVPPEEHPYTVTWTGAAGDGLWATAGNWDKERTDVDTAHFADDATVTVATTRPGAALTVESGKTVTIKGTVGVTAEITGATAAYQALADGATLIADGGTGFRLTNTSVGFGNDTLYKVVNGCYSKISGLAVGGSTNVNFETDGSHLKFDMDGILSTGGEILCRANNANGLFELGTAILTAGKATFVVEDGAKMQAGDLQDGGAVVSLGIGTNAIFNISRGEDHLFDLGRTSSSTLEFYGPNPKVALGWCNAVTLGGHLTVRFSPEASWGGQTLIEKKDGTSEGTCAIDAGVHYEIDTRALVDVTDEFSFYLYNSGKTTDKHNIAVPSAGNVTLVGPCADGFEATFSKPDNYKLMITLTPKKEPQPTVDGEPVDPAEVFAMARSNKPIEYPSAPTLTGEVGAQAIVFGGVSVNVPRHYTATLSGNTVTLALNDFARPVLADSDDDKKAIAVGETTVTLHVGRRIDGLFYRVVTTTALGGGWTPVTEFLPVGDFTVDRKATDISAFYRIEVSDIGESAP